ncbi:hypothetical protein ACFWMJ_14185 [Streptomyces hawaiiensis]|uniref:hypothetical protein n=1 Tax=Streptomyces hawaiiensis TaxID=67305 RepID=UPI003668C8B2
MSATTTVVLATHLMEDVHACCDSALVLCTSRKVFLGSVRDLEEAGGYAGVVADSARAGHAHGAAGRRPTTGPRVKPTVAARSVADAGVAVGHAPAARRTPPPIRWLLEGRAGAGQCHGLPGGQ